MQTTDRRFRVVFQGTTATFGSDLEAWLSDHCGISGRQFERDGGLLVLPLDADELQRLEETLRDEGGPETLFLADLPPSDTRRRSLTIKGKGYLKETERIAQSYGRHALLSAFPSELVAAENDLQKETDG